MSEDKGEAWQRRTRGQPGARMGASQLDALAALQRAGTAPRRRIGRPRPRQCAAVPAAGALKPAYRRCRLRCRLGRRPWRAARGVRPRARVTPSRLATVSSSARTFGSIVGAHVGDELLDEHLLHLVAHALELAVDRRLDDGDHLLEFVLGELFLEQGADGGRAPASRRGPAPAAPLRPGTSARRPGSPWPRLPACPWRRAPAAHWTALRSSSMAGCSTRLRAMPSMPGCCILRIRATSSFLAGDERWRWGLRGGERQRQGKGDDGCFLSMAAS